jgi:hypothetical protein
MILNIREVKGLTFQTSRRRLRFILGFGGRAAEGITCRRRILLGRSHHKMLIGASVVVGPLRLPAIAG